MPNFFNPLGIIPDFARHFMLGLLLFASSALSFAQTATSPAFRYEVGFEFAAGGKEYRALLEDNLDLLRWRGNQFVDEEQFLRLYRTAPEQIKKLLSSEGYFQAKITPSLQRSVQPWQARFQIELGAPAQVASVDLQIQDFGAGPEGASTHAAPEFLPAWNLPTGSIFKQGEWEAAKRALVRQISLTRYPRAQILDSQAVVDIEKHQVQLHVVLDTGPEIRFGTLAIEGLQRYPASVVSHLNNISEGQLYNEQALLDLQQALQDSNYFSNVVVSAEFTEEMDFEAKASVPVLVKVTEYKRKKVEAGLGYSTNTGNRAQLVLYDLAFWGTQLRSELLLETRKQNAALDFTLPVKIEGYHDSIGTSLTRSNLEGEVTVQARLAVHRRWGGQQLTRDFSAEFLHENKTIGAMPKISNSSLPFNYEATWRKLDSFLKPREGYLLQAKVSLAPLPLPGSEKFFRLYGRGVHYWPLGKQGLLQTRLELGALASRNTERVPSTYLFRAGGDQSVRGYAYQELGVHQAGAITGGRFLATASLEYQYWLKPAYGVAVFVDGGNVGNQLQELRPALGYGLGARWNSPVGPINVDIAHGRNVKKNRLHFSLGLAF